MRTNSSPDSTFVSSVLSRLHLTSARARLAALFALVILASTVALSSTSSASSVIGKLFGASPKATQSVKHRNGGAPAANSAGAMLANIAASASLSIARHGHTATRLDSTHVLIAGGDASGTAEIFDSSSGTFYATGSMSIPRTDAAAVSLGDGRVLISGGQSNGEAVASAEIYDPASGTFSNAPDMSTARAGHSATALSGGSILMAGGDADGSAEIYILSSNNGDIGGARSKRAVYPMDAARFGHSAALMLDGKVLIVGGRDADGNALSSGEVFDSGKQRFFAAGEMQDARVRATMHVLFDGKVQIIGGNDHRSMELYDPAVGNFGGHAHLPPDGDEHANLINQIMNTPSRAALFNSGQTITEIPSAGQALVAGGVDGNGNPSNSASIYNSSPASVTTDRLDYAPGTPVHVSGRGFQAYESVTVMLHEDPHIDTENPHTFNVQADAEGSFEFSEYAPEDADVGVTYVLAAVGQTSGRAAQTTFTDGNLKVIVLPAPASGTSPDLFATVTAVSYSTLDCATGGGTVTGTTTVNVDNKQSGGGTIVTSGNNSSALITASATSGTAQGLTNGPAFKAWYAAIGGTPTTNASVCVNFTSSSTQTWYAAYGGPTKLVFINLPRTTVVNQCSGSLQIQAQDATNPPQNPALDTNVLLSSNTTGTGTFYSDSNCTTPITSTPIAATGNTTSLFYYRDNTVGAPLLKGHGDQTSLTDATQATTIIASCVPPSGISISGGGPYKVGDSLTLTANVTAGTLPLTYTWKKGSTTIATHTNVNSLSDTYTINSLVSGDAGTYTVQVSNSCGTGIASDNSTSVTVSLRLASIAVSFASNPITYGGNTSATATVTDTDTGTKITPSGTVTFSSDSSDSFSSTTCSLVAGVLGTATCSVTVTPTHASIHNISAGWPGDSSHSAPSNGSSPLTVNPKTVTASVTATNKTYDGNNSATINSCALSGVINSDVVTCSAAGPNTFDNKNVGTGKTVTATNISLGGANSGNYTLSSTSAATTANITALHITGSFTASNKVYDGNNSATVLTRSLSGAIGGDVVSLTGGTATFSDKNVGNGKTVTLTGASLTGAGAGNYVLDSVSTTTADITALHITGNFTASNKVYDGNNSATVLTRSLTGTIGGDTVSLTGGTATFSDKNVGTGKTVTLSGASLTGAAAGNYILDSVSTTTADITAKHITGGFTADNKQYDGDNSATVLTHSLSGMILGDTVSLTGGTATFSDKNVGTGKTVTLSGATLSGTDSGNYVLDSVSTTTANITALHITGSFTASNKVYDGNNSATVLTRSLSGAIGGDVVSLTGGTATFSDKNVGTGKTVTLTGASLSGADAGNYVLDSVSTTTADITALHITGSFTADNKVYDGNNSATVLTRSLSGAILGDAVSLSGGTATFADKNVGTGKTVTLSGASLTGANAGNYVLDSVSTTTANITAITLTATVAANNKPYDGNATATINSCSFSGVLGGDTVNCDTTGYSASFNSKDVGPGKPVSASGLSKSGTDANNYTFDGTGTGSADITAKTVTASVTASNKPYDGNANATITGCSLSGVVGVETTGCAASATVADNQFSDANVGTGKTVTANNISLTNNASGNYVLSSTSAATTADINKATAVVVVAPYTVSYDGSPHTAGVTSITGVNGETGATVGTVNVSNTTHTNAGTYNADTWSFTGTANYNDIASTTITDSISKVDATVVVTPYSVPYDGNPHTATYTINGVNGESGATVGTVTLNTTHTNAGTYNADTWSFTGAGNYNDIASTTITDTISKINATITVTPYDVPYDGAAHTAGSSATGVGGVDLSSLLTLTTTHTNAGTYSADTWSFAGDTNYNSVATTTITDKINKISAHPVVTAYSVPYDGTEHTATAVSDGGVGSFTLIGTKHTSAGDYPSDAWSFDGGTNYLSDSGTVHDAISKIDATITVTPYDVPYNGNSHTASGTATGVGGADLSASLTLTGTTHTNASTYNGDAWSFSGGTNYNNANGTVDDNISKANANCTVTGYSVTYNGSAHTATGSCTGVGGSGDVLSGLDLSGTTHTNAGTYNNDPWSFTAVTSNYNNTNGTVNDSIGKKNAMWTTNANSKYFSANDPSPLTTGSGSGFLAADGVTATYSRTGSPGATLSPVGGYPITATLSATGLLSNYNITNAGAIFTINPDPTAIAFNGPATASVFNCNQTYSATLTDTITNAGISGVSLTLTIGTQSVTAATNASGVATFTGLVLTDQGNTLPANVPESVSITTSWTVPNTSAPATQTGSFTITQDPNIGTGNTATSLYTGPGFFWTTSPTSSTATLTLNATIRDTGVCLGNITKAKVSFYVSTNDGTSFSPVSNAQNLPVGLVNPLDQTTGTAANTSQCNIGSNKSVTLVIRVVVGGDYLSNTADFDVPVVVAIPGQPNTLTAGGKLGNDAFSLASVIGAKYFANGYLGAGDGTTDGVSTGALLNGAVSFAGFVQCNNNKCTNPQGQIDANINTYNRFDGTFDTTVHHYFIKSNSISNWGTTTTNSGIFSAKTNVYETTGGSRTGIDGGGTMQMVFANPGGSYTYTQINGGRGSVTLTCPTTATNGCASIIIYRSNTLGGGVWFTSAWGPIAAGDLPQTILKAMLPGGTISFTK